jgi:hypothetical protein
VSLAAPHPRPPLALPLVRTTSTTTPLGRRLHRCRRCCASKRTEQRCARPRSRACASFVVRGSIYCAAADAAVNAVAMPGFFCCRIFCGTGTHNRGRALARSLARQGPSTDKRVGRATSAMVRARVSSQYPSMSGPHRPQQPLTLWRRATRALLFTPGWCRLRRAPDHRRSIVCRIHSTSTYTCCVHVVCVPRAYAAAGSRAGAGCGKTARGGGRDAQEACTGQSGFCGNARVGSSVWMKCSTHVLRGCHADAHVVCKEGDGDDYSRPRRPATLTVCVLLLCAPAHSLQRRSGSGKKRWRR